MREPHIIDVAGKTKLPRRVVYYDSESRVETAITDSEIAESAARKEGHKEVAEPRKQHDLYLICATFRDNKGKNRGRYVGPDCGQKFWADVHAFTSLRDETLVIAHNAKYDTQVTGGVYWLVTLGYRVISVSDSNPFIVRFTRTEKQKNGDEVERKITLISSTNYYQQSLASLGKTFGLTKLEFDYDVDPTTDPALMDKALEYCERDVDILEVAIEHFFDFVKREKLGKLSFTIAGQSLQAFRARFMSHDIYIHSDKMPLEVERRAYAGGRNEVLNKVGVKYTHNMYYVDINSMYPYVMKNFKYPTKLIKFWRTCDLRMVANLIDQGYLVCADCLVKTDIPIFHKKAKKLIFPTGTFQTTLSTPEISEGIKRGLIKEIWNLCVYEGEYIFREYVDFFYNSRLDAKKVGDKIHDLLFKLFMNALYGKFGQKNIITERVGDADDPYEIGIQVAMEDGRIRYYKVFGGGVFVENYDEDDLEAYNSFPAIAAHVTANARMQLFRYIETAGIENTYYCDTDSLFVNDYGYQLLFADDALDNNRLGALKLEDSLQHGITFHGCKDYEFDHLEKTGTDVVTGSPHYKTKTTRKIKGVAKGSRELAPDKDGKLQFAVTQWGGFSERLRTGNFTSYYNTIRIKRLKREYDKGDIGDDGKVRPFALDENTTRKQGGDEEVQTYDHIRELCKKIGYIRVPKEGERFFGEYQQLERKKRSRYFRLMSGLRLDEWADEANMTVSELLDYLR